MQVGFRCDASIDIGSGHVMRCLTLANELKFLGANCVFFCREYEGNLFDLIAESGHSVVPLPAPASSLARWPGSRGDQSSEADWGDDALQSIANTSRNVLGGLFDWVVLDNYGIDWRWEEKLRDVAKNIFVIDDLADRNHYCDLLLDQNIGRSPADYNSKIPDGTKILVGTEYALLRPQFAQFRSASLARRSTPRIQKILVTMGGMDKENITSHVLTAIERSALSDDVEVTVVLGRRAPWLTEISDRAAKLRLETSVRVAVQDMAKLMTESDLMIGAGGSTTWERCTLGLPAITVVVAENQQEVACKMSELGGTLLVSSGEDIDGQLSRALNSISLKVLSQLSLTSRRLCDGQGAARVVREMLSVGEG